MPREFTDEEIRLARVAIGAVCEAFAEHGWDALDRVSIGVEAEHLKKMGLWPTLSITEGK